MNATRVWLCVAPALALGVGLPWTAAAQQAAPAAAPQQEQTFHACFVPEVGAIYLIGLPGLPETCLSSAHQPISWTEGVTDGAVTTPKLADQAVTTAKLADQAVTAAKLAVELPGGPPGLACWDRNGNGVGDPEEDTDGNGVVDIGDCRGAEGDSGADGRHCWDTNGDGVPDPAEDTNADGVYDAADCQGAAGDPGADGRHCWDTNDNGAGDPAEDTNGDGVVDVGDCQGPAGDLSDGAVTTSTLADLAVTEAKLADGAVSAAKVEPGILLRKHAPDSTLGSDKDPMLVVNNSGDGGGILSYSDHQFGLVGLTDAPQSSTYSGVYGYSVDAFGVKGRSANRAGVFGESDSREGVRGWTSGSGPTASGVRGGSTDGVGVTGKSVNGVGVVGESDVTFGVAGWTSAAGAAGVKGHSNNGQGVIGTSSNSDGVVGWTGAADKSGVFAYSAVGRGAVGRSDVRVGVTGWTGSTDTTMSGVLGHSTDAAGVVGRSQNHHGVVGSAIAGGKSGVYGHSDTGRGVTGTSANGIGVVGKVPSSTVGVGVWGRWWAVGGGDVGVSGFGNEVGVSGNGGDVGVHAFSLSGGVAFRAVNTGFTPPEASIIEAYYTDALKFKVDGYGDVYADGSYKSPAADFAELMPVAGDPAGYEPGDVLAIGEDGALVLSDRPYATNVAGVYSTQPGVLGGYSDDEQNDQRVPLAIVGIVPVKVSAENGAIRPGDLLVSSSIPGHAMRAGSAPPQGSVLAKALASLETGTGVIQALVTLQ